MLQWLYLILTDSIPRSLQGEQDISPEIGGGYRVASLPNELLPLPLSSVSVNAAMQLPSSATPAKQDTKGQLHAFQAKYQL